MARKVFISVLGSTNYGECHYVKDGFKSDLVRYVQEATLCFLTSREAWGEHDKALILVTDGAGGSKLKNWDDNGHTDRNGKEIIQSGLCNRLEIRKFPMPITAIEIPEGDTDDEIWSIFEKTFAQIETDDELYFDITHGFRYLPMLILVLINYSKFLRNVTVKSITYGNFEGRNRQTNEAQLVDLKPLTVLQDWTAAAKDFIAYGKNATMHKLLENIYRPLLAENTDNARLFRRIDTKLSEFSDAITANKLSEIISGETGGIKADIDAVRQSTTLYRPFMPLLDEIVNKLNTFKANDLGNVFAATRWCIRHELYQNAYSILLEGVISIIFNRIEEEYSACTPIVEAKRSIISYISECKMNNICQTDCIAKMAIPQRFNDAEAHALKSAAAKVWEVIDIELATIIVGLNSTRNSYMHAGTGTNSLGRFSDLKLRINEYCESLEHWFKSDTPSTFCPPPSTVFINLSNHPSSRWSSEQLAAAAQYGQVVDLPFPAVDPEGDEQYIQTLADEYVNKVEDLIASMTSDVIPATVHVMGEHTLTYIIVNELIKRGITCVASTTERVVVVEADNVKTSVFNFKQFRKY